MILLILLGLTFFMQLLAAPWFVMAETSVGKQKSLKHKILCMGIVVASLLLCAAIAECHKKLYFILVATAVTVFSVSGILQSVSKKNTDTVYFALQTFGNASLACAYTFQLLSMFKTGLKTIIPVSIALIVSFFLIPLMCKRKGKFLPLSVISVIVSLITWSMSIHLGILCQQTNIPVMQGVSCALILGTTAESLSVLLGVRQRISPPPDGKPQLFKHCMNFFGQMFLVCSVLIG